MNFEFGWRFQAFVSLQLESIKRYLTMREPRATYDTEIGVKHQISSKWSQHAKPLGPVILKVKQDIATAIGNEGQLTPTKD